MTLSQRHCTLTATRQRGMTSFCGLRWTRFGLPADAIMVGVQQSEITLRLLKNTEAAVAQSVCDVLGFRVSMACRMGGSRVAGTGRNTFGLSLSKKWERLLFSVLVPQLVASRLIQLLNLLFTDTPFQPGVGLSLLKTEPFAYFGWAECLAGRQVAKTMEEQIVEVQFLRNDGVIYGSGRPLSCQRFR